MSYAENEQLRQLQLAEHKMLCDFAKICDKHNLTYFLDFGTLLGAVRHQGFIPWDDDVDVTMPLEDYKKFLKIAQEELGDDTFFKQVIQISIFTILLQKSAKTERHFSENSSKNGRFIKGFGWIFFLSLTSIREWILRLRKVQLKYAILF